MPYPYDSRDAYEDATRRARQATAPSYGRMSDYIPPRREARVYTTYDMQGRPSLYVSQPPLPSTTRHADVPNIDTTRGSYKVDVPNFRSLIGAGFRAAGGR